MVDQNTFLETLLSVKEIITTSETPMKEDEILSYFADMELDGSQKAMVIDYLTNPENYKEEREASGEEESITGDIQSEDASASKRNYASVSSDVERPEVDVYQMYLEDVEQLDVCSAQELDGYYRLLLQGDASVIEKISFAWLKKITDIAQQYLEPKLLLEDLVQEGNMGLFMELSRLCGSMEKENPEELLNRAVEQAIVAYAAQMRDAKELEDAIVGKINLVNAAKTILTEENQKVPTIKELAEYTKIPEAELEALQEMMEEADKEK